jgi:hypothetical protein
MPDVRACIRLAAVLFVAVLHAAAASAQDAAGKGNAARPEVGRPIQAAIELVRSKKGKEALIKVREAQAVRDRTPYENYVIERVLGQAATLTGEPGIAARAFESAAAWPASPDVDKRQLLAAAAGQYYLAKDYAKAAELAERHFAAGGSDRSMRTIQIQALYLANNFPAAAKLLAADLDADEQAGKAAAESQLQLLANAYLQQKDAAGYARAMERLLTHYPKRDYWLIVVHAIAARPGFAERLALDVARLKIETGTMRTTDEYLEAAQLALQDGFPKEATKIIDLGYATGLLGTGAEAARHKRLKDMAARNLAEDLKAIAKDELQPASGQEGKVLLNDGFNYVLNGKTDKGLAMMEQGLRLGSGIRRPEYAKMQLAYAYHLAGQDSKAQQIYRTAQGNDGTAALARLWIIRLGRP